MIKSLPRCVAVFTVPLFSALWLPAPVAAVEIAMNEGTKRVVSYGVNGVPTSQEYQAGEVSTLRAALGSIVPPGWSIFFERGEIAANQRITWETRGNWLDVLDDVAQTYDLQFIVNHKEMSVIASADSKFNLNVPKKHSLVAIREETPRPSVNTRPEKPDTTATKEVRIAAEPTPSPVPAQSFVFDIREGERLFEAMARWTEEAGYQLVWQPRPEDGDVRFAANTAFGTQFEEAAQSFFNEIRQQTKFDAQLHTNRVLRVYVANAKR